MKIPFSEASKRLALLFGRKTMLSWSDKEGKLFLALQKEGFFDDLGDLDLIEQYYRAERAKKGEKGIHRRDLFTFLGNAHGELDRARAWADKNPGKAVRAASHDATPARWPEFIAAVYPSAVDAGWQNAPASVKAEFKGWEKKH